MGKKNTDVFISEKLLNKSLLNYLDDSPTSFHAVLNAEEILQKNGFKELLEKDKWKTNLKGKFYIKKNSSSLIAFHLKDSPPQGFKMYGAHTDSPCLKVKPHSEKHFKNYLQLAVEPYGGSILSTWFDRSLSLAGRIQYLTKKNEIAEVFINFKRPIAFIPNLAIHLDRTVNESKSINKQRELPPVLLQLKKDEKNLTLKDILLEEIESKNLAPDLDKILDYDLSFYDAQNAEFVGLREDFILSSRLDNLLSCFVGLMALVHHSDSNSFLVFNDHEECGSTSHIGADGPFAESILKRLCKNDEDYARMIFNSFFISADNAHGVHPNYPDKHEDNHAPILNAGPVIKINNNQRYSTNDETSAYFIRLAEKASMPYQNFVVRSDLACGTTTGPITTSRLGVRALDIGLPTWSMHSIRESMGSRDAFYLYQILKVYFECN